MLRPGSLSFQAGGGISNAEASGQRCPCTPQEADAKPLTHANKAPQHLRQEQERDVADPTLTTAEKCLGGFAHQKVRMFETARQMGQGAGEGTIVDSGGEWECKAEGVSVCMCQTARSEEAKKRLHSAHVLLPGNQDQTVAVYIAAAVFLAKCRRSWTLGVIPWAFRAAACAHACFCF